MKELREGHNDVTKRLEKAEYRHERLRERVKEAENFTEVILETMEDEEGWLCGYKYSDA